MKDYLLISYNGNIRIDDIPNNVKRVDIIERARRELNSRRNEFENPITQFCNLEVYKNSEIRNLYDKCFGECEIPPEDFHITTKW